MLIVDKLKSIDKQKDKAVEAAQQAIIHHIYNQLNGDGPVNSDGSVRYNNIVDSGSGEVTGRKYSSTEKQRLIDLFVKEYEQLFRSSRKIYSIK